jgi:membrane associated rhomboid family serine protease
MPRLPDLVKRLQARHGVVVVALIAVNIALQLLFGLLLHGTSLDSVYSEWLALSVPNVFSLKVWTLLTYGFLHDNADIFHVLFNMLALFFLGPQFERRWGSRGFVRFWLLCILGGGVAQLLLNLAMLALGQGGGGLVVGASAAVMGLVGAWSWIFPKQKLLLFFVIPIEARRVVPLAVALDIIFAFFGSHVAVGAHLGGLATAWLILNGFTSPRLLRTRLLHLRATREARSRQAKKQRFKVVDGGKRDGAGGDDNDDDNDDDPRWNVH